MKEIDYYQCYEKIVEQLKQGAFLNVKNKNGIVNTMTIAWGAMGYMWRKPVFTVMVRQSRYTHNLIENAESFTVSFPRQGQLKNELNICGTKSGQDIDKFKECNLTLQKSNKVETPVIKECDLHLECKIVYKQPMDPTFMSEEIIKVYGDEKDYHTLYYGEVLSCCAKEDINL